MQCMEINPEPDLLAPGVALAPMRVDLEGCTGVHVHASVHIISTYCETFDLPKEHPGAAEVDTMVLIVQVNYF